MLDVQECPQADVAIRAFVADVLEKLAGGHWGDPTLLQVWDTDVLAELLLTAIHDADQTVIRDPDYLRLFGLEGRTPLTAGELWRHLAQAAGPHGRSAEAGVRPAVETLLKRGPLSRRIAAAVGRNASRDRVLAVYRELADCLAAGRMFDGLG